VKRSAIAVLFLVTTSSFGTVFGGWPEPPWRVLPKLEYIHETANTIWFYSKKDEGSGWPPQYVVTYSKPDKELKFQTVIDERVSKDGPISFEMKEESIPSYIQIEPEEIQIRGVNIPVPELILEEAVRLSEWSTYLHDDRYLRSGQLVIENAFEGSFIELQGVYYLGLKGGMIEGGGNLGGLAVYYPLENKLELVRGQYVISCSITDLKQIGDELAVSTVFMGYTGAEQGRYRDEGAGHGTGLVLYNLSTGQWRNIPFSVPRTFIRKMAVIDGQVWMTTNLGISRYDPMSDEMKSWNWDLKLIEQP